MKRIPAIYWEQNYSEPPTLVQRAWVQRWLEYLDPNTSYLLMPPVVTILDILRGFTKKFNKKNRRVIRPYLDELRVELEDLKLLSQVSRGWIDSLGILSYDFRSLYDSLQYATSKEELTIVNDFGSSVCREAFERLAQNDFYLSVLCDCLVNGISEHQDYGLIDKVTGKFIALLLNEKGYSAQALSNRCVESFLRPNDDQSFGYRLVEFLSSFKNSKESDVMVFMRVQTKQFVGDIGEVNGVIFRRVIPEMRVTIERMRDEGYISSEQEHIAMNFFYGVPESPGTAFAVVKILSASDVFVSARRGLEKLQQAISQVRLEYEILNYSVDNRICIYNQANEQLEFVSGKNARKGVHGSFGSSYRLERLRAKLLSAEQVWQLRSLMEQEDARNLFSKVSRTALAWHQEALDASTLETRFLGHWISLEQIFEDDTDDKQGTAATDLVKALNNTLLEQANTQYYLDLWGDIVRLQMLGSKRVVAPEDGKVMYSPELLQYRTSTGCIVPMHDDSRPKLFLLGKSKKYEIPLSPGTVVLVKNTTIVDSGAWLAGADPDARTYPPGLQRIFRQYPLLEDALFLVYRQSKLQSPDLQALINTEDFTAIKSIYSNNIGSIVRIIRKIDQIAAIIYDSVSYQNGMPFVHDIIESLLRGSVDFKHHLSHWRVPEVAIRFITSELQQIMNNNVAVNVFLELRRVLHKLLACWPDLKDAHVIELYRHRTPNREMLLRVPDLVISMNIDQPLMTLRIKNLGTGQYYLDLFHKRRLALLERLRVSRNALSHEAKSESNSYLLSLYLYKFAHIYLREVIHRMAREPEEPLEYLLYLHQR